MDNKLLAELLRTSGGGAGWAGENSRSKQNADLAALIRALLQGDKDGKADR